LSEVLPIKNGLKPMFINFALEYAIRNIPVNQGGLKLNGTYQFPIYADDVDIMGGSYIL